MTVPFSGVSQCYIARWLLLVTLVIALQFVALPSIPAEGALPDLGPLLPADLVVDTPARFDPAKVVFDGSRYLVVWKGDGGSSSPLKGTVGFFDVAYNGSHYLAVWSGSSGNKGQVIATNGALIGAPFVVSLKPGFPALASDGQDFLMVKEDFGTFSWSVQR